MLRSMPSSARTGQPCLVRMPAAPSGSVHPGYGHKGWMRPARCSECQDHRRRESWDLHMRPASEPSQGRRAPRVADTANAPIAFACHTSPERRPMHRFRRITCHARRSRHRCRRPDRASRSRRSRPCRRRPELPSRRGRHCPARVAAGTVAPARSCRHN